MARISSDIDTIKAALRQSLEALRTKRAQTGDALAQIDREVDRQGKALALLEGRDGKVAVRARKAPAKKGTRQRGVGNRVASMLADQGKATAADVTRELGVNSGSVQYALRGLEEKGVIRQTGRVVGRTREYEFIGSGKVSEPGSGA